MKEICVNCKGEEKTAYERRGHKKAGRKEMTTGLDEDRDIAHMAQTQTHPPTHTNTHRVPQCSSSFQYILTTERLQKHVVSHWFHIHGKQNQKANSLATLAKYKLSYVRKNQTI